MENFDYIVHFSLYFLDFLKLLAETVLWSCSVIFFLASM